MSFISAILGGKDGAVKGLINKAKKKKSDRQADTSSPGHTHNSESKERRSAAEAQRSSSGSTNIGSMANAAFMGKGEIKQFNALTTPKAELNRGGSLVSNQGVQTAAPGRIMGTPDTSPISEGGDASPQNVDDGAMNTLVDDTFNT